MTSWLLLAFLVMIWGLIMSYKPVIFASYNRDIEFGVVEVFRGSKYLFKLFLAYNPAYRELTIDCWDDMNNGYIRYRFQSLTYKRLLDCTNKSLEVI